jgi:putative ABC transport system substrate-binding protein
MTGWPLTARAQQPERRRRVGVLMPTAANDREGQARYQAFEAALKELGWTEGQNLQIDTRWTGGLPSVIQEHVTELAALAPDVILGSGAATVTPLLRKTTTVPVVFTNVIDPVGAGLVQTLAKPGGNATGVMQFEYGLSAKWLDLLKEVAPTVTRAAVLRDIDITAGIGQLAAMQSIAPSLGVELLPVDVRSSEEIKRALRVFARVQHGGLIVTGSPAAVVHRDTIVNLAAEYKLPAVYYRRLFVSAGGLVSYGSDPISLYRRAAVYVDRILRGAKPSDLPVEAPAKYELAVNQKTARALGLTIPSSLLARADEVIE